MLVGAPRLRASLTPAPDLNIARSEKMLILEMGFVLSSAPSILQRFLIAVVPYWCVIPGKTLEAVHEAVLWSWQAAFRGLRPGRALHVILPAPCETSWCCSMPNFAPDRDGIIEARKFSHECSRNARSGPVMRNT